MSTIYLLDFTESDFIVITLCAVHIWQIDPVDIDCKYVHQAKVYSTEQGNMIAFSKWVGKKRIEIGERKVIGYVKRKGVRRIK